MARRKRGPGRTEEWIEFDYQKDGQRTVGRTQFIQANGEGIKIHAVTRDRVLGVDQIRGHAKALLDAADYAQKNGCPPVLME